MYVPTPERVHLDGTWQDFRPLIDRSADPAILDGRSTEGDLRRVLGPPAVHSDNDRVAVYTECTERGFWLVPDGIDPGDRTLFALALRFDGRGTLEQHRLFTAPVGSSVGLIVATPAGSMRDAGDIVMRQIDDWNGVELVDRMLPSECSPKVDVRKDYAVQLAWWNMRQE